MKKVASLVGRPPAFRLCSSTSHSRRTRSRVDCIDHAFREYFLETTLTYNNLSQMLVLPPFQRQGIGAELLRQIRRFYTVSCLVIFGRMILFIEKWRLGTYSGRPERRLSTNTRFRWRWISDGTGGVPRTKSKVLHEASLCFCSSCEATREDVWGPVSSMLRDFTSQLDTSSKINYNKDKLASNDASI